MILIAVNNPAYIFTLNWMNDSLYDVIFVSVSCVKYVNYGFVAICIK